MLDPVVADLQGLRDDVLVEAAVGEPLRNGRHGSAAAAYLDDEKTKQQFGGQGTHENPTRLNNDGRYTPACAFWLHRVR